MIKPAISALLGRKNSIIEMMRREIDKVKQGLDPIGIMRDTGHAVIDSKLAESLNGPEFRRELRDIAA